MLVGRSMDERGDLRGNVREGVAVVVEEEGEGDGGEMYVCALVISPRAARSSRTTCNPHQRTFMHQRINDLHF